MSEAVHRARAHAQDQRSNSTIPCVLIPFRREEAISLRQAAELSGRTTKTVKAWCGLHDIGRPVAGRWLVSRVALQMYLDGDRRALRDYLVGDRTGERVRSYFVQLGLP
jgi:hypothetical protein